MSPGERPVWRAASALDAARRVGLAALLAAAVTMVQAQQAGPTPPAARPAAARPAAAQASSAQASPAESPADGPLDQLPYAPVLDPDSLDRSVDPCEDFYRYACGGWQRRNPIPADQASWDVTDKLQQDNRRLLRGILERLAEPIASRTPDQRRIGDAYAACMDEAGVEARGTRPLAPLLSRIDALGRRAALPALLAQLQRGASDPGFLFVLGATQDLNDSSRVIASLSPPDLGLPDRDYYFKTDARSRAQRADYVGHVRRMFGLLGDDTAQARREAAAVMRVETALAGSTLKLVDLRDPHHALHKTSLHRLQALTPSFDWRPFLKAAGAPGLRAFDLTDLGFFRALDRHLRHTPIADLRSYLRWHLVHADAPYLPAAFVQEDFAFYGHTLQGVPQPPPRWRSCVAFVDSALGEALGQEFVRRSFGPGLKARTLDMTVRIEAAMDREIRRLDWMSARTKARALEKLHAIRNKIGYPDHWRDYGALAMRRDDLLGDAERASAFEFDRQLARIGHPPDHSEWGYPPQTVNAYYDAQMNDINFMAGILQPPLFDARLDAAPNYGDTGSTIGHELTHGFDDEGRLYDGQGNLRDWWSPRDARAFEQRASCLRDQYAQYVAVDDLHIDSRLTLGEDLADLGGVLLAWLAWQQDPAGGAGSGALRDGLTPEQRFFVGAAQWACSNDRPETLRLRALTDPHSPDRYRVNGVVSNLPAFEQAFQCRPGQPMAPVHRCSVW